MSKINTMELIKFLSTSGKDQIDLDELIEKFGEEPKAEERLFTTYTDDSSGLSNEEPASSSTYPMHLDKINEEPVSSSLQPSSSFTTSDESKGLQPSNTLDCSQYDNRYKHYYHVNVPFGRVRITPYMNYDEIDKYNDLAKKAEELILTLKGKSSNNGKILNAEYNSIIVRCFNLYDIELSDRGKFKTENGQLLSAFDIKGLYGFNKFKRTVVFSITSAVDCVVKGEFYYESIKTLPKLKKDSDFFPTNKNSFYKYLKLGYEGVAPGFVNIDKGMSSISINPFVKKMFSEGNEALLWSMRIKMLKDFIRKRKIPLFNRFGSCSDYVYPGDDLLPGTVQILRHYFGVSDISESNVRFYLEKFMKQELTDTQILLSFRHPIENKDTTVREYSFGLIESDESVINYLAERQRVLAERLTEKFEKKKNLTPKALYHLTWRLQRL